MNALYLRAANESERARAASPLSRVSYLRVWEEDLMSLERINILGAAGGIKRESEMLRQLGDRTQFVSGFGRICSFATGSLICSSHTE